MEYTIPKKLAVINDIAGYGRCSLSVALPVISAMKVQACPVPTSYFSNHMGFPSYFSKDLSDSLNEYLLQWENLNLLFDGIYCGYLNSLAQMKIITSFILFQKKSTESNCKVIIDPVMGDHGTPYKSITSLFCDSMKSFIKYADILTPNLTEACILTDTPYLLHPSEEELFSVASKLQKMGAGKVVITGIPTFLSDTNRNGIANYIYESETVCHLLKGEICGESRPGTGDLFASIVASDSVNSMNFSESVKKASDFVRLCTRVSHELNIPTAQGVCFENFISQL